MALLTGMTEDGQEVPVQVKPDGRLVAEGLMGPQGLPGKDGLDRYPNVYVAAVKRTPQVISTEKTFIFETELRDPYSLYDASTGVFTVTAEHVGTYQVFAGLNAAYLQVPSGESTFVAGVYKNGTQKLQYQEIWETTNPDETTSGASLVTVAELANPGDFIDVKGRIDSSSGVRELGIGSSLVVVRLF